MNKIIVSVLLTFFAAITFAEEDKITPNKEANAVAAQNCTIKDTASLYYTVRLDSPDESGKVYEEKVDFLTKLAKDNDIEGFHILSQDVSVGHACCGSVGVDLSVSFTLEYEPSYKVLTILAKESGAQNISSSRYSPSDCK
jgi:hypothetical protein